MKKKVDSRVRDVMDAAVKANHRAMFVIVGDKGKDQVVNLHYMLSKARVKARPSVLWCYKKELGFSSHRKKRMKHIKKMVQRGLLDPNQDDPFELFISTTDIRYTYYSETQSVLGNTYGVCVLQDFEAITPNVLARTIETVQGGGMIVLLLRTMSSLRQVYSMVMDVHSRMRTQAFDKVVARFNERFILSLADCPSTLFVDDELNVLPLSQHIRTPVHSKQSNLPQTKPENEVELDSLKASLADTMPVGPLVSKTKTIDQARAVLNFVDAISEKTLRSTVALTASRGRGKSAALGLAVAAAIGHQYSNIFVTSPSPENLKTFFEFLFVGFDALEFVEHTDYEIIQSTDPAMDKCVVRVNVFRGHRQTVQYVEPADASKSVLAQAELLVIDEAAAIPLPIVKSLLGPYLVFISSTVTGYEGTGRSLSLKLIQQLRLQASGQGSSSGGRQFRDVVMETPVRYSEGDPIEHWLYDLLCLDVAGPKSKSSQLLHATPHPSETSLYAVDRDALFSRHRASEAFLQKVMALFVSSHYKNSPNDLQLLADAPAHQLFVLLGPTDPETTQLPDVLCAIQVCYEGRIPAVSAKASMARGQRAAGDLIPWTLIQQFQDSNFAGLAGARIVRVATHPDVQGMGYGGRAISELTHFLAGSLNLGGGEDMDEGIAAVGDAVHPADDPLHTEKIGPRTKIPPLLRQMSELKTHKIDYVGVSFGLTEKLYEFWKRLGFLPVYTRLSPNDLTGEHTCIMLRVAEKDSNNSEWLANYYEDFHKRFANLLGYDFRSLTPSLALSLLSSAPANMISHREIDGKEVRNIFSAYDLKRLESYSNNLVDYHVVVDMLPSLATLYFIGGLRNRIHLSVAQSSILVGCGLQHKSIDLLAADFGLGSSQILALFNKAMRKLSNFMASAQESMVAETEGLKEGDDDAEIGSTEGDELPGSTQEKERAGDILNSEALTTTTSRETADQGWEDLERRNGPEVPNIVSVAKKKSSSGRPESTSKPASSKKRRKK